MVNLMILSPQLFISYEINNKLNKHTERSILNQVNSNQILTVITLSCLHTVYTRFIDFTLKLYFEFQPKSVIIPIFRPWFEIFISHHRLLCKQSLVALVFFSGTSRLVHACDLDGSSLFIFPFDTIVSDKFKCWIK